MTIFQLYVYMIPLAFPLLSWRMKEILIGIKREGKGDLLIIFMR